MRRHQHWLNTAAAALVLFLGGAMVPPGVAGAAPHSVATVLTATGTLSVRHGGGAAMLPLAVRGTLSEDDVVSTGPDSKASLLLEDGSQLKMAARSAVQIGTTVGKERQSLFQVLSGVVWTRLRPNQQVWTRYAKIAVRGTEISLEVGADGTTTLMVVEGEVHFFNEHGSVEVGGSKMSVVHPGSAPTMPVTIPSVGLIIEWTHDLDHAVIPREKFFISPDGATLGAEELRRGERARRQPEDPTARRDYGDVLFDRGKYDEALREYQVAGRLAPGQPATLTRLGYALLELDQLDDSEASFRLAAGEAPRPRPGAASPALAAAPLASPGVGGAPAALRLVAADAITAPPANPPDTATTAATAPAAPALVGLASLELARDHPAAAQVVAERAVATGVDSAEARIGLGLALMRQPGKADAAATSFRAALTAQPATYAYQAHAWLALVLSEQGDNPSALAEAGEAVRLAPRSALARGNLALVNFYNGRPLEAEREARLATQLNPRSVAARCVLGQALLARGDVDEATRTAAQAVALDPSLPQAHYLLGVADAQRRDYSHAARALKDSLRLAPEFLPAASTLARVYTLMGRKPEAVALLNDLLPRHRETDGVLAALGEVYYQQGDYNQAVASYQKAVQRNAGVARYHAELARVAIDANRLSTAMNSAQEAVRLEPGVAQFHAILGLSYYFSGLSSQSEREFRSALTIDPQNALARIALAVNSTDQDTAASSATQATLFDPAVLDQLRRGGINTELTPSSGTQGQRNLLATHGINAFEGRLHTYGFFDRTEDNGDRGRRNDDTSRSVFLNYLGFNAGPRTTLFADVENSRLRQGLPGPLSSPSGDDPDDRLASRGTTGILAVRQRLGVGSYLWGGLNYQSTSDLRTAPGLLTYPTGKYSRQAAAFENLGPELRLDLTLNRDPARQSTLTLGAGSARLDSTSDLDSPKYGPSLNRFHQRHDLFHAQFAQRVNRRFSFVAQLRRETLDISNPPPGLTPPGTPSRLGLTLPSLQAGYSLDKRTALRLFVNRRIGLHLTPLPLTPTETLLTTETFVLPTGQALRGSTEELDLERYLPRGFLKLLLFRTTAHDLTLGGAGANPLAAAFPPSLTLAEARRVGAGVRYERRLNANLNANVILVASRTTSHSPGFIFDNGIAPYQPSRLATLALDYVDPHGNKARVRLRHEGAFYQDSPLVVGLGRPRFPAHTLVDLRLAKEPSLGTELFIDLSNIFDQSRIEFNNFPTDRRRLEIGVTRRF